MAKLVARDSHLIDDGYLFLFLNSKQITIKSSCRGTTVPHVSPEALVSLKLSLPPLIEQERIVDLVSSVDSYIFALQQQADAARAARSAVLNELLSADGNDWRQVAIHDAVELGRERLDPRSIDASTMLHHWSIPALDEVSGPIYEPAGAIKSHKFRVRRNAVVFSLLNPRIPRYALIEGGEDVVCSTEFAVMYPKSNVLNEFLLVLVSSALFQEKVTSSADGTTKSRERTRPSDFDRISIVLPSLDEQSRIATLVTSIDVLIQTNKRALSEARSLRSALLSDLLSGDHEIRESYDRLLGAA
jgi:type I restriction enzyme S subunit